ncbi:YkgJ family cysteine cluster protein [Kaarinaea lacus]
MNTLTAKVQVKISGEIVTLDISIPDQDTTQEIVLPLFWQLTEMEQEIAISRVEQEGKKVSCQAGCGACCRQFVPVTPIEARYIDEHVSQLPKKQRQRIRSRIKSAHSVLEEKGLLNSLLDFGDYDGDLEKLGLDYFHLGIPCPYLEDESCSIHKVRPLSCREYLVTNPAKYCKNPSRETIHMVPMPSKLSSTLAALGAARSKYADTIIPLSISRSWIERHPEEPVLRHSKQWLEEMFTALSKIKQKNALPGTLLIENVD